MGIIKQMVDSTINNNPQGVANMVTSINNALIERATFERFKKPNGANIEMRRVGNAFADNPRVAAFFVANNIDPMRVFNFTRKDGYRSDLKGLQKVRKLIDFLTDRTQTIDMVSKALFASSIIAAKSGVDWLSSNEQELILSPEKVGSLPKGVQEAIRDFQHKHMTVEGDSRPQACRFRTTYNNLGVYDYDKAEDDNSSYSLGIMVDLDNPIIQDLSERWGL